MKKIALIGGILATTAIGYGAYTQYFYSYFEERRSDALAEQFLAMLQDRAADTTPTLTYQRERLAGDKTVLRNLVLTISTPAPDNPDIQQQNVLRAENITFTSDSRVHASNIEIFKKDNEAGLVLGVGTVNIDNMKITADALLYSLDLEMHGFYARGEAAQKAQMQLGASQLLLAGQPKSVQELPQQLLASLKQTRLEANFRYNPDTAIMTYTDSITLPAIIEWENRFTLEQLSPAGYAALQTFKPEADMPEAALASQTDALEQQLAGGRMKEFGITLRNTGIVEKAISIASAVQGVSEDAVRQQALVALDNFDSLIEGRDALLAPVMASTRHTLRAVINGSSKGLNITFKPNAGVPLTRFVVPDSNPETSMLDYLNITVEELPSP